MSKFKMDDSYVEVNVRIKDFFEKYPEGRLRQKSLEYVEFAGQTFVVYTAEALRTPDDPNPSEGTAQEPFPGTTPYTKGSEVQNAETSAWGRAIIAANGSDAKDGVASRDEIRNRQEEQAAEREFEAATNSRIANAPSRTELQKIYNELKKDGITKFNGAITAKLKTLPPEDMPEAANNVQTVMNNQ